MKKCYTSNAKFIDPIAPARNSNLTFPWPLFAALGFYGLLYVGALNNFNVTLGRRRRDAEEGDYSNNDNSWLYGQKMQTGMLLYFTFIQGGQFLLPQRANDGKGNSPNFKTG